LIGSQIGSYQIVSLLGAGGMGEVYRARDTRLDRDVALKVLPVGLLADEAARRRFRKEALALAKLSHPHIAVIHDVGEEAGVNYLVMECVPGHSLAEKLKSGALTEKEVAPLGAQIADALEEAHEHSVIHRDLKPGNIMVTPKGQVKVLDFGLAKLLRPAANIMAADTMPTESFAETQGVAGTLPYMAPEQLTGEPVDARTDIYALGVVLFEMAAGRRLFQEDSAPRLTDAILHQQPVSPRALNSRVSPELERIILKCLEKSPEDRYQSAKEVQVDLRRLGVPTITAAPTKTRPWWRRRTAFGMATIALIVSLAAAAGWVHRSVGQRETIDSLAVLPFVNTSADPNTEYLSDGITESLINSLSQLPHLKVMSRDSAFMYKGKQTDARTVGSALGVRAVLEGRVMQHGDNLEISAELVDTRDNSHIWGQQYSRKSADIFALQGELAKEMTTMLRVRLTGDDQRRMTKSYTANPEAYQDYLKGRYWWNKRTEEGLNKGIEYFQQAIAKDPTYALAYSGLADCYNLLAWYGFVSSKETYPRAKDSAQKALEIDDTLAEAHASLAWIKTYYDWDWSGAEKEFQQAIQLNPSYATAHNWYGNELEYVGRREEAIAEHKRALELDPLSLIVNTNLGLAFYMARQYDQAIEQYQKTLQLDPNFITAHSFLGLVYIQKSMYKEGIAEFEKELVISPGNTNTLSGLGYAYAVAGRGAEAQKVLDKLQQLSKRKHVSAGPIAQIFVALGEKDEAFEWLKKGSEDHSITTVKLDPAYDPLRSDPRFADLLRRMNLQP
jgi:serine/threonine protein kinase/Flp pilus assembly protein TadD